MSGKTDYTKLSRRELQDRINKFDSKADEEYNRRLLAGEIKTRPITFEEISRMYKQKNSKP